LEKKIEDAKRRSLEAEKRTMQLRSETEQLKLENAKLRQLNARGRELLSSAALLCLAPDSTAFLALLAGSFSGGVPYWCVIAIKTHLGYQSLIT
jgi:hypothetical protein